MAKKIDKSKQVTESPEDKKVKEFLEKVNKQLKRDLKADEHNRVAAIEDLRFLNGDQWDDKTKTERKNSGRPCLQINLLPQYVDQVVGDIRHNSPRAKLKPVDSKGDVQVARIREGLIANIEHQSNANSIYVEAGELMTGCGYGAWRVLTRYTEENPFVQEIYLEAIENPFTVVMDCAAKGLVYEDSNHGFILSKIPRDEFEERYPDATAPGSDQIKLSQGMNQEHWYDKDTITVAEYYVRDKKKTPMCQLEDGTVLTKEEADKKIAEWKEKNQEIVSQIANAPGIPTSGQAPMGAAPTMPGTPSLPTPQAGGASPPLAPPQLPPEPKIVKTADAEVWQVKHYTLTALEILSKNGLEGEPVAGKYVPIILATGKRLNVEGKRYIRGLIRNGKDPQRNVNYWYTAAAERIALEPKAPWVGTPTQFEGFQNDYARANVDNQPFLMYNPDMTAGQLAPPPMRQGPGQAPVAMFQQLTLSEALLKNALGMQNASSTESGPERTGAAVTKKQTAGDVGTFAYIDNLIRAINHSTTIINEMIPEIYDTQRDARIRHLDESEAFVPINTTAGNAYDMIMANKDRYQGMNTTKLTETIQKHGREARFNDISKGKYGVTVTVGPSYATQRSEAVETMLRLTTAMPKQMGMAADLIIKNSDFKDADVLAKRLEKTLPPGIAPPPAPGEPPRQPLPPPPQVLLAQEKVKLEQEKTAMARAKLEVEKIKVMKELQGEKGEIKKMILEILMEAHAPAHPADAAMNQIGGLGNGPAT